MFLHLNFTITSIQLVSLSEMCLPLIYVILIPNDMATPLPATWLRGQAAENILWQKKKKKGAKSFII